jgi:hypothetical protein
MVRPRFGVILSGVQSSLCELYAESKDPYRPNRIEFTGEADRTFPLRGRGAQSWPL